MKNFNFLFVLALVGLLFSCNKDNDVNPSFSLSKEEIKLVDDMASTYDNALVEAKKSRLTSDEASSFVNKELETKMNALTATVTNDLTYNIEHQAELEVAVAGWVNDMEQMIDVVEDDEQFKSGLLNVSTSWEETIIANSKLSNDEKRFAIVHIETYSKFLNSVVDHYPSLIRNDTLAIERGCGLWKRLKKIAKCTAKSAAAAIACAAAIKAPTPWTIIKCVSTTAAAVKCWAEKC